MASAGASGHSTLMPSCNRLLQKKWDDRKFQEHKDRLRKMKSSVDNQPPRNFVHIKQNLRRQREEEDRMVTIQRHNNELLSRMHHIMHTTGRIEHKSDWKPKKSLNYMKRQVELERISRENQSILRRIQTVKPQYSSRKWETDFRTHRSRAKSLSVFPEILSPEKVSPPRRQPESLHLPPIGQKSRPETQPSEIQEEIEVDDQ